MRLVWYQRQDGLWNAACACNATVVGIPNSQRAEAEAVHFQVADVERKDRSAGRQIPPCGPKLPDPNPNLPDPFIFP